MKKLVKPFSLATGYGTVAVLAIWALAMVAEVDLTVSPLEMQIPLPAFVMASIVGGLGAFLVSSLLLKTKTPKRTGQIIGWIVLGLSLANPFTGTSDLMAIITLEATHFAIGVPLLMAMAKHLPAVAGVKK